MKKGHSSLPFSVHSCLILLELSSRKEEDSYSSACINWTIWWVSFWAGRKRIATAVPVLILWSCSNFRQWKGQKVSRPPARYFPDWEGNIETDHGEQVCLYEETQIKPLLSNPQHIGRSVCYLYSSCPGSFQISEYCLLIVILYHLVTRI